MSTPGVVATTILAIPECATSQLGASLGSPDGTAGTIYYQLTFTNTSTSATCTMQGYPGVSFVAGSDGHQVGAPARRETGPAAVLTLGPGQSASATLGIVDASAFGSGCQLTPVMGLRIYPPNNTAALYVAHGDQGCASPADVVLNVRPVGAAP